jgi:hypothetical protein
MILPLVFLIIVTPALKDGPIENRIKNFNSF